jgi:hypothetical protein
MAIAENEDLVAFQVLMPRYPDWHRLFRRCCRTFAVNDRELEQLVLMKLAHRAGKYPIDKALGLPSPHRAKAINYS